MTIWGKYRDQPIHSLGRAPKSCAAEFAAKERERRGEGWTIWAGSKKAFMVTVGHRHYDYRYAKAAEYKAAELEAERLEWLEQCKRDALGPFNE